MANGVALPSMAHQAVFALWLGAMGLLDEAGRMSSATKMLQAEEEGACSYRCRMM